MSITTDRIASAAVIGPKPNLLDAGAESYLFDALVRTLDSVHLGVLIVGGAGRILHANKTAQDMLDEKSPIAVVRGRLCALQPELTKELQRAIAAMQVGQSI